MLELVGYRDEYADLCARVWRGPLLVSVDSPGANPFAPPLPDAGRILVAPGVGIAVFDEIDHVCRSARLSVATLTDPAGVLGAAVAVARDRLRLHRVFGLLSAEAEVVVRHGFEAEVTIPQHLWLDGAVRAGTIWGRCFDVE
ncbi:hypothetical protein LWC34_10260 [Kibdelosporangium philippinense]|uniref:Uncharacterized protein n=1 Tax=Kibdelosporangium philippinense TaxID=211113 RepID=A0ABS8Z5P9_9PSEU|nr:hypothetical protein [Kibdelosporangium philippinense]MCE7003211.1 hypothetical protein [Kibdelosporangium philippinense]